MAEQPTRAGYRPIRKQVNADLTADLQAQVRINQADASAPTTDAEWNNAANREEL